MGLADKILELTVEKHNTTTSKLVNRINFIQGMCATLAKKTKGKKDIDLADEEWRDIDVLYRATINCGIKVNELNLTYELISQFDTTGIMRENIDIYIDQIDEFITYFQYLHNSNLKLKQEGVSPIFEALKNRADDFDTKEFHEFLGDVLLDSSLREDLPYLSVLTIALISDLQEPAEELVRDYIYRCAAKNTLKELSNTYYRSKSTFD